MRPHGYISNIVVATKLHSNGHSVTYKNFMMRRKFTWDRELDYEEWDKKLSSDVRKYRELIRKSRYRARFVYSCILLVQLRNAARISEAVEAIFNFMETGSREYTMLSRKGGDKRVLYIPPEIRDSDRPFIRLVCENRTVKDVSLLVRVYANRHLGINTHSLRYAAITYLGSFMQPQFVAKITGHTKVQRIVEYLQFRTAKEILRDHVFGDIKIVRRKK